MTRTENKSLENAFAREWDNPPTPFNPAFDPTAKARSAAVVTGMEFDNFYSTHTREQCAAEYRTRYDAAT